jgi:hypothetical protein
MGVISIAMCLMISCGYKSIKHGEEITPEQVAMIVDGKTTKKDMFVNFGDPTKTMDN